MKNIFFYYLIILGFASSPLTAYSWERTFNFDKDSIGRPPEGFVFEGNPDGRPLFIVKKEDPKETNRVLALNGATFGFKSAPSFAMAWFSNVKNGTISVDFMHTAAEKTVRKAGLAWRHQSSEETYVLECDTKKSVLRLIRIVDGKKKVIEDARIETPPLVWLNVEVKFKDDLIQCNFMGKTVFEKTDSQISETGKAGIYLDSDTAVIFDNFKIKSED
jgi:hypothetical protein